MKKTNFLKMKRILFLALVLLGFGMNNSYSQLICTDTTSDQVIGEKDGYRYEIWNLNTQGSACMTLGEGAKFSGEWIEIENYLARRGFGYDQTQEHQEIGTFSTTYSCEYNPRAELGGNSYLGIYGWTVDPLVEFYILDDWRNWIPSMAEGVSFKGSLEINGSIYDIYEYIRVNQPSIVGTTTFPQIFSIRRDKRNSGTIDISEHFKKWEELGMVLGKMYEVAFAVEGYHNSGSFDFTELDFVIE